MKKYKNLLSGEIYEDECDAFDEVLSNMTWEDYFDYFENYMSYQEFFMKCKDMPNFFDTFEREFGNAEYNAFDNQFEEIEEEDNEG